MNTVFKAKIQACIAIALEHGEIDFARLAVDALRGEPMAAIRLDETLLSAIELGDTDADILAMIRDVDIPCTANIAH